MRKGWRGMLEEPLRNNSLYPVASQPLNITHILKSPFPFAKNFLWRSFASLTNWKKKKTTEVSQPEEGASEPPVSELCIKTSME